MDAQVHIHTVRTDCKQNYEGTLSLDSDSISSGLKINKKTKLTFIFTNSSFLGNSTTASFPVYLDVRKNNYYDFVVSYKDNIYNVVLYETDIKSKKRREVNTQEEQVCANL